MIYTPVQKSKTRKPNAAQRQLMSEWDSIVNKHKVNVIKNVKPMSKLQPAVYRRPTIQVDSHKVMPCDIAIKPKMVYTGNKIIGIGTLHKSNAVPVFSQEEAIDISKMRRG